MFPLGRMALSRMLISLKWDVVFTLAKCLNSLLVPDSGVVMVAGISPKNDEDVLKIRQKTGMVFQNPDNQIVSTIVEDDVAFGAENLGIDPDEIRKRVDDALMEVDIYKYRQKAMHSLSGGQKQRISIAGILAMKPEFSVIPTSISHSLDIFLT